MTAASPLLAQPARLAAPVGPGQPQAGPPADPCTAPIPECPAPTASPSNLLSNASYETLRNCLCYQPRNIPNFQNTKVCTWVEVNNTRSDIFHTCASTATSSLVRPYGAPNNLWGTRSAHTGNGYLGFLGYDGNPGPQNRTDYRGYVTTPLAAPLEAGRTYYAEYYVSLADLSQRQVSSLGFAATVNYLGEITDGRLTGASNPVNVTVPPITVNNRTAWVRVGAGFQAAGGESYFTIGNFDPVINVSAITGTAAPAPFSTPPNSSAYYYLDDALLMRVPKAGADLTANCNAAVTLPTDGPALPTSSGATYRWTANTDPNYSSTTLVTSVNPQITTTYTLTVTVPGQVPATTVVSSVTVYVQCCYTTLYSSTITTIAGGTYTPATLSFAANTSYRITGAVVLQGGTFTLPSSSTIYVDPNITITVNGGATLVVDGGTITAGCQAMWKGIGVAATGNFISRLGGGRRAEISNMLYGVTLAGANATAFSIADTDFLQNYASLSFNDDQRTGTVTNCKFFSAPLGLLPPYAYQSATNFSYSMRHVQCNNSGNTPLGNNTLTMTGNTLQGAMFGVWVNANAQAPVLQSNNFTDMFVAGVYCNGARGNTTTDNEVAMRTNRITFPTNSVHDINPPQLATAYSLAPGSSTQETYGLLENGPMVYRPRLGNRFDGPGPLILGDPRPTYRQVGITATAALLNVGTRDYPRANFFSNLYEGIRLPFKSGASIVENQFYDCVNGLHLLVASGALSTYQVQCNSFFWSPLSQLQSNNEPRGILVDAGQPVQLVGTFTNPPPGTSGLLKNLFSSFSRFSVVDVYNNPSNPLFSYPTFVQLVNGTQGYQVVTANNVTVFTGPNGNPQAIDNSNNCAADGYNGLAGLRPNSATSVIDVQNQQVATLESCSPNPAAIEATVRYHIPATELGTATLVVRSVINGKVVREFALTKQATSATLSVQDLPEGVYVYTLLVNGRPFASRRLMVAH